MPIAALNQPLPRAFYNRATPLVAQALLGMLLVRRIGDDLRVGRIVETEGYLGETDPAAHSAAGRTKRTQILYGEAGRAYVYQLRHHYLLNVVTEEVNQPTCVLFRALEPVQGFDFMDQTGLETGLKAVKPTHLMNGPAKLCRVLQIDLSLYGVDLTAAESPLYIAQGDADGIEIEVSTRIGITKAVDRPLRFTIKGSPYLSRK